MSSSTRRGGTRAFLGPDILAHEVLLDKELENGLCDVPFIVRDLCCILVDKDRHDRMLHAAQISHLRQIQIYRLFDDSSMQTTVHTYGSGLASRDGRILLHCRREKLLKRPVCVSPFP